jgi:lipopolysaccharide/colanic/teichoic acid biosynthesis glycosyltransferase
VKRLIDVALALLALVLSAPMFGLVAAGIRLCSPGPIFHKANRVGLRGQIFRMYKFRTMDLEHEVFQSAITGKTDPRVFPLGAWLRYLKIDELPQLLNILKGDMSIVGPRPEDPGIVEEHYAAAHMETLSVLPGLSSPGSIYYYTHMERELGVGNPEQYYVERILPVKIALDRVYLREASRFYDAKIMLRTLWVVVCMFFGRRDFPEPPELSKVEAWPQSHVRSCEN